MSRYSIPPAPARRPATEPKTGVPGEATFACGLTVCAFVLFNVCFLLLLVLPQRPDTGTVGGEGLLSGMIFACFAYVVALVVGGIGAIHSVKRQSPVGIWLGLVPVLVLPVWALSSLAIAYAWFEP